jgi:hypothetical protein
MTCRILQLLVTLYTRLTMMSIEKGLQSNEATL